ncbi:uncharacterized protein LOC116340893 isoform X2 [Contarinia nasturtii]|uniref:uncharacterized protein LOC116340893 isoform X2 n=1 Tax=Contarinia nasturtii TaxID=265458 RepID=UPI0012D4677D|nr:uncharacterized protein LOC116340893 isoform X2 [Contarinia nasturtii]
MEYIRKNLWKKEKTRNKHGKQYVDLFDAELTPQDKFQLDARIESLGVPPSGKNDDVSMRERRKGNQIACAFTALDVYNKSLRYAKANSVHVALIYANRASCYYQAEEYRLALENISMAKRHDKFPRDMLPKLLEIEEFCKNAPLEDKPRPTRNSELTYIPHEKHPCLAKVVKIDNTDTYGRNVIARFKLEPKDIILIEEDYIKTIDLKNLRECATCFAEDKSFIACDGCTDAMFCNINCQAQNQIHKWECNTFITQINYQLKFIIHSILLALQAFTKDEQTDIDKLMECVEKMKKNITKLPNSTLDPLSKYIFYFKLATSAPEMKSSGDFSGASLAYVIFQLLMKIPKISDLFETLPQLRFLMHLIVHHNLVNDTNSFGGNKTQSLGLVQSLFNHACKPNLDSIFIQNKHFYIANARIKPGQQLYISYIDLEGKLNREQRRAYIQRNWGFVCGCEICKPKNLSLSHKINDQLKMILANRFETIENTPTIAIEAKDTHKNDAATVVSSTKNTPEQLTIATMHGPDDIIEYPSGASSLENIAENRSEDTSTQELVERVTIATIHTPVVTRQYPPGGPSLESKSEVTTEHIQEDVSISAAEFPENPSAENLFDENAADSASDVEGENAAEAQMNVYQEKYYTI